MKIFKKLLVISLCALTAFSAISCKKKSKLPKNALTYSSSKSASPDGKFYVVSISPQDELPSTVKYPSIQIQFSEPAVALQKLGEPSDKSDIVTITPPINGVFRWYGTSLLSFDANEMVIDQKVYKVTINKDATSVNGNKITGDLEFTFHPEELKIVSIIPGYADFKEGRYVDNESVPTKAAKDILVSFNFPVKSSVISKYLSISTGKEDPDIPFSIEQEKKNAVRLSLKKEPPEDSDIYVFLKAGAMADENCYETSSADSQNFHTLVPFEIKDFDTEPYVSSNLVNPIAFKFSTMLQKDNEEEVAKHIKTSLGKPVTKDNIEISGYRLIVHSLPVTFGESYRITIDEDFTDIYGRKLGESATYNVTVPEARSFAYFKDSGLEILEAQFTPKIAFEHQNIKSGSSYTVTAITDAQGNDIRDSGKSTRTDLDPDNIPQNTTVIQPINLSDYLTKTGSQYHGTVQVNSNINYEYKYTDWQTDIVSKKIDSYNNSQTVQVTDLGVTVRYAYNKAAVLVTSMSTGKPVPNADVYLYNDNEPYQNHRNRDLNIDIVTKYGLDQVAHGKTDASGFAILNYNVSNKTSSTYYVEAKTDNDRVIFRPSSHNLWSAGVYNYESIYTPAKEKPVTFMFTDRGLYKPGEKVSFRGYDKNLSFGEYSEYTGDYKIELIDDGWDSNVYYTDEGTTSKNGTFWGKFTLPDDLEPGEYRIRYTRKLKNGSTHRKSCSIQVQFFERLRFEVKSSAPDITYYSGDSVNVAIKANYLGGGSLAGSTWESSWTREKSYFSPKDKTFSKYTYGPKQGYDYGDSVGEDSGALSAEGTASISQTSGGEKIIGSPYIYKAQALVTDAGGQQIATSSSVKVHPARYYIGLNRTGNVYFPKKGDSVNFDYICITPDETEPLATDLPSKKTMKIEVLRKEWKEVQQLSWSGAINTRYQMEIVTESETETSFTGTSKPANFTVKPENSGEYIVRVSSKDRKGHDVVTETTFYVTSYDWSWNHRDDDQEISMTTNKDSYDVGDEAQILVQSPLPKGTYLMTIEREGLVSQELKTIDTPTTVLTIPIKEEYIPVMYVTLSSYSVRSSTPKNDFNTPDVDKPKGLFGVAELIVNTAPKMFDIDVTTDKPTYQPGEKATIKVHATKNGKPLSNAEVTLMAVDRGVIDLINYHVPNPVQEFYSKYLFPDCVSGGDSRYNLIDPVTYEIKNLIGGDSDKFNERKNFDPTALFEPEVKTDANGNATCTFTLPDSLTAYRITAVGISGNNFALTESEMNVANPVSVRTALPRQLRLDDHGEAGVVISNLDNITHEVSVFINAYDGVDKIENSNAEDEKQKTAGSAKISGESKKTIKVAADKTEPLMFNLDAKKPGWITIEFIVKSDVVNEKILLPLQIEKPYIYETVTTVGEVREDDKNKSAVTEEKLILPADAEEGRMELYVQLDPTRLGVLGEAIRYVFDYPYGCLEQRSSMLMPIVAFDKYIKLFGLDSKVKNTKSYAKKEINYWSQSQLWNGGFPYWPSGSYANEFVSARIAEILALADENGVDISSVDTDKLADYLVSEGNSAISSSESSAWSCYRAAHDYYAASLLGAKISVSNLEKIVSNCNSSSETLALVGLTYLAHNPRKAKDIADKLRSNISLTTRGATFKNSYDSAWGYWSFFNDQSECFALALQLFTTLDPADKINQHLVYQLLELQKSSKGYWTSTAATSRVLIAIREYIQSNNLENLNFTAEALLDKKSILKGNFKGTNAQACDKTLSKEDLASTPKGKEVSLEFTKQGTGTLFYTASMKYALPVPQQTARDEGICIYTQIYDVKTGELVTGDKLEYGKTYKEKVYISSTKNRTYIATRVPIPAGCEVLNAAFVTTGTFKSNSSNNDRDTDYDYYDDYDDDWYDRYNWGLSYQGIYDSEVQYFWDYFPIGYQQVEFLFRAGRRGTYNTPCSTAECMYESETFGRGSGKVWTIE